GRVVWGGGGAGGVVGFYRQWIREVPGELTTIVKLARAPALPVIPASLQGRPVVILSCCYAGPLADGTRVLRPLRTLGTPLLDLIAPRPYLENQALNDPTLPHGWHYYWTPADTGE